MVSKFIRWRQYTPLPGRFQYQILQKAGLPAGFTSASIRSVFRRLILLLPCLLLYSCRSVEDANQELLAAVKAVNEAEIRQSLHSGASANAMQSGNETALGLLISQYKRSHEERRERITAAATLLLEQRADPNALHHGYTPLQIATGQGCELIVSRLLVHGADPNLETRAGLAPIWQAVFDNNHSIGLILLQAGANPNALNQNRETPLQYLRKRGYQQTRLMIHLRQYGGK